MTKDTKKKKTRTGQQNKALHKLCQDIADYCVETGLTADVLLEGFGVYPEMETIKMMIRSAGMQKFGKKSTADLTTTELQKCYEDVVQRHVAEKTGEYFPFPSEETRKEALESYNKYIQ